MRNIPEWWTDASWADVVDSAQGDFASFRGHMEGRIVEYEKSATYDALIGYVRYLSVQGTEGPIWTICYSAFGFMPLPLHVHGKFSPILCNLPRVASTFMVSDLTAEQFLDVATHCAWVSSRKNGD